MRRRASPIIARRSHADEFHRSAGRPDVDLDQTISVMVSGREGAISAWSDSIVRATPVLSAVHRIDHPHRVTLREDGFRCAITVGVGDRQGLDGAAQRVADRALHRIDTAAGSTTKTSLLPSDPRI